MPAPAPALSPVASPAMAPAPSAALQDSRGAPVAAPLAAVATAPQVARGAAVPAKRFGEYVPATVRTDPVALARIFAAADTGSSATAPSPSAVVTGSQLAAAILQIAATVPSSAADGQPAQVFKVDTGTADALASAWAPEPAAAPAPQAEPRSSAALAAQQPAQAPPAEPLTSALSSVTARLKATESRLSSAVSLLAAAGRARAAPKGPPLAAVSLLAQPDKAGSPAAAPAAASAPRVGVAAARPAAAYAPTLEAAPAALPASAAFAEAPARVQALRNLQPMDEATVAKRLRLALTTYLSSTSAFGALTPAAAQDATTLQSRDGPFSLEDVFAAAIAWQIANGCAVLPATALFCHACAIHHSARIGAMRHKMPLIC